MNDKRRDELKEFFSKAFYVHDPVDRVLDEKAMYPVPLNDIKNISLSDAIDTRASELHFKYDKVYLMWSGGIDSTTALFSFIKNDYPLTVVITENSKKEYPKCYEEIIAGKYTNLDYMEVTSIKDIPTDGNYCIMTGELGDQMMGSAIALHYSNKYRSLPYKEVISPNLTSITEESIEKLCGTLDLNVGEYLWAINFIYKFENVINRLNTSVETELGTSVNLEHFFNHVNFQYWSINTFREHANFTNKYKYKIAYKEYIYGVNGDKQYLKWKRKLGSLANSGLFVSSLDPDEFIESSLTLINVEKYEEVRV